MMTISLRNRVLVAALAAAPFLFAQSAFAGDKPEKGFKSLWNGKDFSEWSIPENPSSFTIRDGAIVAQGPRSHAFYTGKVKKHDFKNFELKVDCMTQPKSNGGIYIHTAFQEKSWPEQGFEIQVNNTHGDWRKTGGIYAVEDNKEKVAEDGKWFTQHIIVKDNTITVLVDGKQTAKWTQPEGYVHPQFKNRKIGRGTIALQAHDPGSVVMYKNLRIKPLK